MAKKQKQYHDSFIEYMQFIVDHPNYKGMPSPYKKEGGIRWVATKKSKIGQARLKWWEKKRDELGISKEEIMQLAEILVLAVVGLLVILLVVRPVLTRLFESMPTALAGGPAGALGDQEGVALAQLTGPEATADMAELLEEDEVDEEDDSLLDQMIDINQVEGRVRASSLKQIGEIVDKHPEEAIAIVRNWMYQEGGT